MEPTILICGRYIDSTSTVFYDKYIKTTNLCSIHKFGSYIINERQFDNPTIISFIEEIAKMKMIYPNFLTSCQQLISRQKMILTNCIGTLLLKLTTTWLEYLIDYESVNPELFETDMFMMCNDMCQYDYSVSLNMTTLIKKINLLVVNCECNHVMTLSQKMCEHIPIYSKLNLVHDILSKIDFTDHKISIDVVIKDAFTTINREFRKPQILNKKLSELPRNLRTKINETRLESALYRNFFIMNKNDIVTISDKKPLIHKNDMKEVIITRIDNNDSICMICDSVICRPMYYIKTKYGNTISIKKYDNRNIICNIFCDILLEYIVSEKIINSSRSDNKKEILMIKNLRTKLFLLCSIKIQVNFCSDVLKYIGLFFLATMKLFDLEIIC